MKIKIGIMSDFKKIDSTIADYCIEKYFVKYFERGEIPKSLDKDENLIIEGEGELITSLLKKYIDDKTIVVKPTDFENDIYINACVIYSQSEDSDEQDDEEESEILP